MRPLDRLVLLAFLAVVAGIYPLLAPTPHRIDQAHFDIIQDGMTKADVEAIIGVPAGQYDWAESDLPAFKLYVADQDRWLLRVTDESEIFFSYLVTGGSETWVSRHGALRVGFDRQGRVVTTRRGNVRIVPPWQRWWKAIWGE